MKSELKKLHDRDVICPIDKAANNVAVICKKFYALVLMKELGLISNNNNNTYNTVTGNTEDEIVTSNVSDLKAKFKVNKISKENLRLPQMHWIPKLHKSPIKARFIIAASHCSI